MREPFKTTDGQGPKTITWEWLRRLSAQPDRLTLVGHATRVGLARCWMTLEWTYFQPGTPANNELELTFVEWPEHGMMWAVAIMPWVLFPEIRRTVAACNMRCADGVPTVLGGPNGPERFPLDNPHVWGVENATGSPVYMGQLGDEFAHAEEDRWIKEFQGKIAARIHPITGQPL